MQGTDSKAVDQQAENTPNQNQNSTGGQAKELPSGRGVGTAQRQGSSDKETTQTAVQRYRSKAEGCCERAKIKQPAEDDNESIHRHKEAEYTRNRCKSLFQLSHCRGERLNFTLAHRGWRKTPLAKRM